VTKVNTHQSIKALNNIFWFQNELIHAAAAAKEPTINGIKKEIVQIGSQIQYHYNADSTLQQINTLVDKANLLYQESSTDFFIEITSFIQTAFNMVADFSKKTIKYFDTLEQILKIYAERDRKPLLIVHREPTTQQR
jgi:hypothetical protein